MAAKKTSTKTEEKPAKAGKKAAAPKEKKLLTGRRGGVASTFRELIMQGKLTDDAIFAEVRKRHPEVTPEKRSYVAWYRNDLKKKGENPPAPKKELKKD